MKTKIVEEQFLVSILYLDNVHHSFTNVMKRTYFTDDDKDFVEITRLVNHKQIKDYRL
jgi:hypothetical protein